MSDNLMHLLAENAKLREARDEAAAALAGLADCINTELRENGPHDDQISGSVDMRPFVRRLVDRVNARCKRDAERQVAELQTRLNEARSALDVECVQQDEMGSACRCCQRRWGRLFSQPLQTCGSVPAGWKLVPVKFAGSLSAFGDILGHNYWMDANTLARLYDRLISADPESHDSGTSKA